MSRNLIPLLLVGLPLVLFVVWLVLARRKERLAASGRLPHWQEAPWTWIGLAVGLALIALFVFLALEPGGGIWDLRPASGATDTVNDDVDD